jgi:membrane dipeptidase
MRFTLLFIIILNFVTNYSCNKTNGENNQFKSDSHKTNMETKKIVDTLDLSFKKFDSLENNLFELHYDAVVVDTHNDILMQIIEKGVNFENSKGMTQTDLMRMNLGGLDVQMFSIYVPEKYKSSYFRYAVKEIDKLNMLAEQYPEYFSIAKDYPELIKIIKENKICGLMGGEGGNMIEGKIENLITLYEKGLRYLTLTWNNSNDIGSSARDETERNVKTGLTDFGKDVVIKMNELGIFVDVSHVGELTFWDVINTSTKPIIASHSCVYNLCPHYRNLKDDQIKAIAKSGGVIFVNFHSKFLDPSFNSSKSNYKTRYSSELNAIVKEYSDDKIKFNSERSKFIEENKITSGTSIDMLIEHIDYIVKLVGVDYVGLGSDFDGEINPPNELYDVSCYPLITEKLVKKGYSENDIRKILGLNFLRIFKQISN